MCAWSAGLKATFKLIMSCEVQAMRRLPRDGGRLPTPHLFIVMLMVSPPDDALLALRPAGPARQFSRMCLSEVACAR